MAKEKFFNPDKSDKTDKLKPDKREVPIGRQVKMHEKLPAIKVENEVNWINDEIKMPFNFQEGKSTEIGVFLTPNPKGGEPIVNLNVMDEHFRSALLGKVIFEDKQGRLYRDIDIKGMGHISKKFIEDYAMNLRMDLGLKVKSLTPKSGKSGESQDSQYGFLDREYAVADIESSEFFVKKGLRTHRGLALIEIKEVVDENGNKISISKAKRKGYLKKNLDPVIEVRAFGTKSRIADSRNKELLDDAVALVGKELGKKKFEIEDYLRWFAKTLGEQIAIIHNSGYFHDYLTPHNITLDCWIVDLDSVGKLPKDEYKKWLTVERDFDMALDSFRELSRFLTISFDYFNEGSRLFQAAYHDSLNPRFLKEIEQNTTIFE